MTVIALLVVFLLVGANILSHSLNGRGTLDFEAKAKGLQTSLDQITLGHVIKTETDYNVSRGGGKYTCRPGLGCFRGYKKYFGIKDLSSTKVDTINDEVLSHGWTLNIYPTESYEYQKNIVLSSVNGPYGFTYKNLNGYMATVDFAKTSLGWKDCNSTICKIANSDIARNYVAIVSVEVSYQTN